MLLKLSCNKEQFYLYLYKKNRQRGEVDVDVYLSIRKACSESYKGISQSFFLIIYYLQSRNSVPHLQSND